MSRNLAVWIERREHPLKRGVKINPWWLSLCTIDVILSDRRHRAGEDCDLRVTGVLFRVCGAHIIRTAKKAP